MKMKEWHRTVLLLVLLGLAIGYLVWTNNATDANFVQTVH